MDYLSPYIWIVSHSSISGKCCEFTFGCSSYSTIIRTFTGFIVISFGTPHLGHQVGITLNSISGLS